MKGSISYCLIVYVIGMLFILNIKPKCMLSDGYDVFKSYDTIDLENYESYLNIYIFSLIYAYVTYKLITKMTST